MSGAVSGVGVTPVQSSCVQGAGAPPPSLVPEPEASFSVSVATDAMSALYEGVSQLRDNSLRAGQVQVSEDEKLQQAAIQKQLQAIQKADDDRPHGFWHDLENVATAVAEVAAVVGSAALTVATVGAGAPVLVCVALALSIGCGVGGAVVSQTHIFGDKTALIGLGMSLAGAACGFGGSLAVTGTTGALHFLQVAGGAAQATGGGAKVAGGIAHIVNGVSLQHVEQDQADAVQAQAEATCANQSAEWTIDDVRSEDKSYQEEKQTLQAAMQTSGQIPVGIANAIKG